jgi:dihydroorotase
VARDVVIRGGRVIDASQGLDIVGDLYARDGRIVAVVRSGEPGPEMASDTTTIEAGGAIVSPGFVDLHCHLREPGLEEKETIADGTRAAARGGFTSIVPMANTRPPTDSKAVVEYVQRTARAVGAVRVFPVACVTKGMAGLELVEMGELAAAGVVAFSDDGKPVANARLMRAALEYSRMFDLPIMPHSEDPELAAGGMMNEGPVATRLGLKGWPAAAEEIMIARDLDLAALTGGRLHVAHVSTAGGVELVRRAKAKGLHVTAEATPHHLALTDEWVAGTRWDGRRAEPYDTNTKVNPPLRSEADRRALLDGLKDGSIDAIATDHAPHSVVDKLCEYDQAAFGISGFETALATLLRLVRNEELDLKLVLEKLTVGPARAFGLEAGTFAVGSPADVVVFGPNLRWTVDPREFASKGKNTPLAGLPVVGKVIATLVGGEVVYSSR